MASNLKSRLARIRKDRQEGGHSGTRPAAEGPAPSRPAFLETWDEVCPFVYSRTLSEPLAFPPSFDPAPFFRSGWEGGVVASSRLRFFDLETTGLSGGTGTVAFLGSVGRIQGARLVQRQLFLADYPGEGPFIEALLSALLEAGESDDSGGVILASYNGRSFDLPLLRTRCVMNGLALPEGLHLDLLHPARRLWRRVHGGASLGLLESAVLGWDRGPDVPGALIPGLYFDFLKGAEVPLMAQVLSHNAEDVHSLAALFAAFLGILAEPLASLARDDLDRAGLSALLFRAGRMAEGEALLRAAAEAGDEAAGIGLVRLLARAGRDAELARALGLLGEGALGEMERAKYLEHWARDWRAALEATGRAQAALDLSRDGGGLSWERCQRIGAGLSARRIRLERKIAREEGREA